MKIKLEVPYNHYLIITPDNDSGTLLKALANAQLVTSKGYGNDIKWEQASHDKKVTFEIVDDSFIATPHDAVKKLTASVEEATNNWLKIYQEKTKIAEELKTLQEKIKELGVVIV